MTRIEVEREEDGRWFAEALDFPGVLAYGATAAEARKKVMALAMKVGRCRAKVIPVSGYPAHQCRRIAASATEGLCRQHLRLDKVFRRLDGGVARWEG